MTGASGRPVIRVRRIRNFFIRFKVNLSEYGSYLLHIHVFRYIRQHHLLASFTLYSLQNIRTIRMQILIFKYR
jgi:hypothetical protein